MKFSNFNHQLYLKTVNVKKFRIALTKLRISSHRLEIEVGRCSRPNGIRTKFLLHIIPSAHFCIGGHNPSHVFATWI